MARYVKFMRGTPEAYKALAQKDNDTLYFIYDENSDNSALYLGEILIASGDANLNTSSIDELEDVLISEGITHDSLLVYDIQLGQWTNKTLSETISTFIGATALSNGIPGLVPAPKKGQTNLFLRSDGTWAALSGDGTVSTSHNIFSIDNESNLNHLTIIEQVTADLLLIQGDIIIIRDKIFDNNYEHTAYVYNGKEWCAMSGNYSAESVYFNTDFIFTENLGTVKIPQGQGNVIVPASGKNVKTFFTDLFQQEKIPTITQPSISVSFQDENYYYEVGTIISPSYEIKFHPGTYEFNSETNVQITAIEVTDTNGNSSTELNNTFNNVLISDEADYKITAKVKYNDGIIPSTALGNPYTNGQIMANEIVQISNPLKGYRNIFYGTFDEKTELTSDIIRSLASNLSILTNEIDIPVVETTQRVVLAIPETEVTVLKILDTNAMNIDIINSWKIMTVPVEGANNYEAINYKIYYLDFGRVYNAKNIFKVILMTNNEN